MQTKDSMKIIDAWNAVSNKNATTVEKMASGMAKAGSTAHSMGLDMNQLNAVIGTVTASTKQSGAEVGNFVKSVLPRLLSKPAQKSLKSLGVDFLDKKTGDMRNVMDIYSDVADKIQYISKTEKAAVLEGLAGKFHISRMSALLDNMDMYRKMLNESKNSEGSAATENEKYMKSLTARIAVMKQEFEQLALMFGKAFLTEGFIQSLKGLSSVAQGLGGLVKTVGGMPLIFGTATFAISLMSKTFRGLLVEGGFLNGMFVKLGISAKGFGFALRSAIASTGVGLAIVAVSAGIEYLLKKMGEARQKEEELEQKNRELVQSYQEHRKDVQSLASQYEDLDKKIRNGKFGADFNIADIEKYKNISNQLAQLMPELSMGEDQYGNKIIGSNEKIKARIELLEKQTAAQEKIDAMNKKKEVEDAYNTSKNNLNDLNSDMSNFMEGKNQVGLNTIKQFYDRYNELRKRMASGEKLTFVQKDELQYVGHVINEYESLGNQLETARLAHQKATMDMIDNNVKLDGSTGQLTKSMINDFTTFVATSDASETQITKVLGKVLDTVQNDDKFRVQTSNRYDLILIIGCTLHIRSKEVFELIQEQKFKSDSVIIKGNNEINGVIFNDLDEARRFKNWIESIRVIGRLKKAK
jgi:hypothetical protein